MVFISDCRKNTLYASLRKNLGEISRKLAARKDSRTEKGHPVPDHVHMTIAIPLKHAVSQLGYTNGKSAIQLTHVCGKKRNFVSQHSWARGYLVSTVAWAQGAASSPARRLPVAA